MKKEILSLIASLLLLSTDVLAQDTLTFTAKPNSQTAEITIEGTAPAPWGQRTVSIMVFNPNKDIVVADNISEEDFADKVYTFETIKCEKDGSFSKTFKMADNAPSGNYTVRVAASAVLPGSIAENDKEILFVSKSIADHVCEQIDQAQSAAALRTVIDGYYNSGGEEIENAKILALETQTGIYKTEPDTIAKYMFAMKPFGSIGVLQTAFEKSSAIADIEKCAVTDLGEKLAEYKTLLELESALGRKEYKENKEGSHNLIKERIDDLVSYSSFETEKKTPGYFIKQMSAIAAVNDSKKTYEKAYKALCENSEFLGIDFDDYNGYSKLSEYEVSKFLNIKRNFTHAETIKELLEARIKELKKSADNSGNQSSGDTGGGGTGGVSITTPRPSEPIAVEPIPHPPTQGKNTFEDVTNEHWAYEAVTALSEKGVIHGMSEEKFEPMQPLLREQIAKMLVVAFDLKLGTQEAFNDVDSNSWFAPYVNAAHENGIIKGISEESFGVGLNVSRQDLMVMIYRALKSRGYISAATEDVQFSDSELISDYARESISALYRVGIVSGSDIGIEPLRNCSRAEAAKILHGAMERVNKMKEAGVYEN